jgi:hypothetical protein
VRVADPERSERTLGPGALREALAGRCDGLRDETFRKAARGEVGLDAEAAGTTRAQRTGALVREGAVADPAELTAAGDGRVRGLPAVAERDETRRELVLGVSAATEEPRRDVERRRRGPVSGLPAPARSGRL